MFEMVKELILSQGKIALVDDEDYDKVSQYKWHALQDNNRWYAIHTFSLGNKTRKSIKLHRFLLNPKPDEQVDHINGDGLDNQRYNIRIVTNQQNQMNSNKHSNGKTSIYKGVNRHRRDKIWMSYIVFNRKQIHLGYFINEDDAARAYDEAALKYYGEYAKLNFKDDSVIMGRKKNE